MLSTNRISSVGGGSDLVSTTDSATVLDVLSILVADSLISTGSSEGETVISVPNIITDPNRVNLPLLSLGTLFIKIRLIGGNNKILPIMNTNPVKNPSEDIAPSPAMRKSIPKNHAIIVNIIFLRLMLSLD